MNFTRTNYHGISQKCSGNLIFHNDSIIYASGGNIIKEGNGIKVLPIHDN